MSAKVMWVPAAVIGLTGLISLLNLAVSHAWQFAVMALGFVGWAAVMVMIGRLSTQQDGSLKVVRNRATITWATAGLVCVAVLAWAGWMLG